MNNQPDYQSEPLTHMIKDFYNRSNTPIIILAWTFGLASMALAIYAAVMFFKSEPTETRNQILFATLFLVGIMFLGGIKTFAWQIIHRNRLLREIRKLKG